MAASSPMLHGGFDPDEAREIVKQNHELLRDQNIVSIDVGMKKVKGSITERPALIVGVISKMPPEKIFAADSAIAMVQPKLKITCSKVTSTVSTKLGSIMADDGSHSFEMETDVVETGEIIDDAPANGGDPAAVDWKRGVGTLGVNIDYEGEYRLLGNAHTLTAFDSSKIGSYVYSPSSDPKNKLFPVTGLKPVTYYTIKDPPNPVYNTQDVAWAKITDPSKVTRTIRILNVTPKGIRSIKESDKEFKYVGKNATNRAVTCALTSLVASYRSQGKSSSGSTIYTFWKNAITYKCSAASGDSGSALISVDNYAIGLHRAHGGDTGYGCVL